MRKFLNPSRKNFGALLFFLTSLPLILLGFIYQKHDIRKKAAATNQLQSTQPVRGKAGDFWADVVVGKRDFGELSAREIVDYKLNSPGGVIVDRTVSPGRAYIWDSGNSRIVGVDLAKCYSQNPPCKADIVIGQPQKNDWGACNKDASFAFYPDRKPAGPDTLCGIAEWNHTTLEDKTFSAMDVDSQGNLYVVDIYNNRVLKYNSPLTTDTVADEVWGQDSFSENLCNKGASSPSASSLCTGHRNIPGGGVYVGDDGLWVADSGNHRILRFPKNNTGGFDKTADLVLGQSSFTGKTAGRNLDQLNYPSSVTKDKFGNLYVTDTDNDRVIKYIPPFTSGKAGELFGAGSVARKPRNIQKDPQDRGLWIYDEDKNGWTSRLRLLDYNNLVLLAIDNLILGGGSAGFDTEGNILISSYMTEDVALFNAQGRLMKGLFSPPPGFNLTTNRRLEHFAWEGIAVAGNQLIVGDSRLLFWNNYLNLQNGQAPDGVVGGSYAVPDEQNQYHMMATDGENKLWVVKSNYISYNPTRASIEAFQTPLTQDSKPIKIINGSIPVLNSTEKVTIIDPRAIVPTKDSKFLWVAEPGNHRVIRIRNPLSENPVVDIVLGQTKIANNQQPDDGFNPNFDPANPKFPNMCNRGLIRPPGPPYPELNMLCFPDGVSLDQQGNLFVSDHTIEVAGNWRMLMFKKELFPENNTSVIFAPSASKSFPAKDCSQKDSSPHMTFRPAFDSKNRMVVGVNPYSCFYIYSGDDRDRFLWYYNDPTKINTSNPSDPSFAQADGKFNDFYNWPVSIVFDRYDNLLALDANRGHVLIYWNPFNNPQKITTTGRVSFEKRGNPGTLRWIEGLKLQLFRRGISTPIYAGTVLTNINGYFKTDITYPELPAFYDFLVKGKHSLSRKIKDKFVTFNASSEILDFGILLEGDINGDDVVSDKDLLLLRASINKKKGERGFNPQADLNEDGIVNFVDQQILLSNFCKTGEGYQGTSPNCQRSPLIEP